jgi:hypothetical protein
MSLRVRNPDRARFAAIAAPCFVAVLFGAFAVSSGCETEVTEYHRRPSFYRMASDTELVDEYVDSRGRRVVFIEDGPLPGEKRKLDAATAAREEAKRRERARIRSEAIRAGKPIPPEGLEPEAPKAFMAREVFDDGSVVMRALLPDHVLANTMTSLRNQEYLQLWEQVVAESTKRQYAAQGMGAEDFVRYCTRNRSELMMTLNRMSFGYYGGSDVILDRLPDLSVRMRFSNKIASQFKFREIYVVQERDGLKLAGIN